MTRPLVQDGSALAGATLSLRRLRDLAQQATQRTNHHGGLLKVLEMLMGLTHRKPNNGGRA